MREAELSIYTPDPTYEHRQEVRALRKCRTIEQSDSTQSSGLI